MRFRKILFVVILVVFSSIILPKSTKALAEPETWTFDATESTYVSTANPQTNYSSSNYLYAKNKNGDEQMSLMKFNISSIFEISGQPTVEGANLRLYVVNPATFCSSAPAQFYIERLSSDWIPDDVVKVNMPLSDVESISSTAAIGCPAQAGYQSFAMFEVARSFVEERKPNYGFVFAGYPYLTGDWMRTFSSSRATNKPQLQITFADYVSPSFTSVGSNNITKNSAKIVWTTDEQTSARVDWGTSASYGSTQSFPQGTQELALSSLSPGTTYHFKLTAYDHFSNSKATGDYTFTTLSEGSTSSTAGTTASSSSSSSSNSSTKPSASATSAKETVKTVDESIALPNVNYIMIGDKKTEAPFADVVNIKTNEELIIGGDSFPSAKIVIIIGDQAYSTDADGSGIWEIKITAKDIKIAKYEVTIQAQDVTKNKGSEIKKAFDLSIEKEDPSTTANTKSGPFSLSKILFYNLAAALLALILLSILIIIHLRRPKKLSSPAIVNNPKTVQAKK